MSEQVNDARRGVFWMNDDVIDRYGSQLGAYGLCVYTMLCRRADKNGRSYPSLRRMSEDLGMSERQAKRELKKLRDMNLIAIEAQRDERGQHRSSVYTVLELPAEESPEATQSPGRGDSQSSNGGTHSHPSKEVTEEKEGSEEKTSFSSGDAAASADDSPTKTSGSKPMSYRAYCHKRARELIKEAKEQSYSPDTLPDKTVNEWSAFYESAITRDGYSKEQCDAAIWWLIRKASGAIEGEPQGWAAFGTGLRAALAEQDEAPNAQTELEKKRLERENAELEEMAREAARLMSQESANA